MPGRCSCRAATTGFAFSRTRSWQVDATSDVEETPVERSDQTGAAAVEYAIVAALIAVVVAATVALLGEAVTGAFQNLISEMRW